MAIRSLVSSGVSDAGQWQIDATARQQLQRAQLIASAGDGDRLIQRIASESSNWRRAAVP